MTAGYRPDLAFVHDEGFGDFARRAAPAILRELSRRGLDGGVIVDAGCGSGALAEALVAAGRRVVGFDASEAMIALARARVPGAEFRVARLADAPLPPCDAIVAVGEVVNYRFDGRAGARALPAFFRRAFSALRPGGVLLFDFLAPLARGSRTGSAHRASADWAVLVTRREDRARRRLVREITTFRRAGTHWRRDDEVHELELLAPADVRAALLRAGFRVALRRGWGAAALPAGHRVVTAAKPEPRRRKGARGGPPRVQSRSV